MSTRSVVDALPQKGPIPIVDAAIVAEATTTVRTIMVQSRVRNEEEG
ncbi:MAG: hypothetical protein V5A38_05245 [Halolamina sp.]